MIVSVHAQSVLLSIIVSLPMLCHGAVDLPTLGCDTYASVEAAESACYGSFYMWGEYELKEDGDDTRATAFSSPSNNNGTASNRAAYGPYMCSTCNLSSPFGFVCQDGQCPPRHTTYNFDLDWLKQVFLSHDDSEVDRDLPQCPPLRSEIGNPYDCIALQRMCEWLGYGWLIEGKSFDDGGVGHYTCAGCSYGDVVGGDDGPNVLQSPPMIALYVAMTILWLVAIVVDYTVFLRFEAESLANASGGRLSEKDKSQLKRQWFNQFFLQFLGVTDENDKPTRLRDRVCCKNYACWCPTIASLLEFVSVLLMAFATTIISGAGAYYQYVCSFSGEARDDNDNEAVVPIEDAYFYQFRHNLFEMHNTKDLGGDSEGEGRIFDPFSVGLLVPELMAFAYLCSISLLAKALDRSGHLSLVKAYVISIAVAAVYCVAILVAWLDDWDAGALLTGWVHCAIIIFAILGPLTACFSWLLGKALVCCKVLVIPDTPPTPLGGNNPDAKNPVHVLAQAAHSLPPPGNNVTPVPIVSTATLMLSDGTSTTVDLTETRQSNGSVAVAVAIGELSWTCAACTFVNDPLHSTCVICEEPKGHDNNTALYQQGQSE